MLVNPLKKEDNLLICDYKRFLLETNIKLISINQSILINATQLRANYKIKTPDAIQIATTLSINCDVFLTDDLGLKNIPNLNAIVLKDIKES